MNWDSSSDETGTSSAGDFISSSDSSGSSSNGSSSNDSSSRSHHDSDDSKSSGEFDLSYDRERLINKYMRKFKCSRRRATKKVEHLFSEIRFEKFRFSEGISCFLFDPGDDLGLPQNRVRKIDDLYNNMIDMSDNWREMRSAAHAVSGGKGDMNSKLRNMNVKKWPPHSVPLFLRNVLDYEKERIIFRNKHLDDVKLRNECERIRLDHIKLTHIVMEEIILLGEEPAKRFLCDVIIKYLDPSNIKELLAFYVLDESRRRMVGNVNFNTNNNNYSTNGRGTFKDLSKARALPDGVCYWWTFGTCKRGNQCPYKHICVMDEMKNHGLRSCLNFKNLTFGNKFGNKNNNYNYNSGNRGFGRGRGFNNSNMNRNRYNNSTGDGYPPPPTSRRRIGDADFSFNNWNMNNNNNNNNHSNDNTGTGHGGNSGMMPSVPGMQYTMMPVLTPISDNKKRKKTNPN